MPQINYTNLAFNIPLTSLLYFLPYEINIKLLRSAVTFWFSTFVELLHISMRQISLEVLFSVPTPFPLAMGVVKVGQLLAFVKGIQYHQRHRL